jgi:hypothetical protein
MLVYGQHGSRKWDRRPSMASGLLLSRSDRSILKNQNYRIWDEIGPPPHRAICKSRAIILVFAPETSPYGLFWPEYESKINVMVSFLTLVAS